MLTVELLCVEVFLRQHFPTVSKGVPTVSKEAPTVCENAPIVTKEARRHICKQGSLIVSRKLPIVSKKLHPKKKT